MGDLLLVHRGQLDVQTLWSLFKPFGIIVKLQDSKCRSQKLPFQFCQCGFDALSKDCVHYKVLIEEALPAVLVPLKDHEITIIGDFTAYGTNFLWVKEFCWRPVDIENINIHSFYSKMEMRPWFEKTHLLNFFLLRSSIVFDLKAPRFLP